MTQHDTRAGAQARSATRVSQRRTWAAPDVALRQHPNAVSGPPRPVSSASPSRIGPATLQHCFGASLGTQKQKIGSDCNFFAIRDCRLAPKRDSQPQNAAKKAVFGPGGAERSPQSQKKLQRYRVFCFCNGLNRRNRADSAKNARNIIASNPKPENEKGARYADAFRKINLAGIAGIYASLAPYCS